MKRRRLALSCVACRRRKVKCGREMPSCVRCVRGGHGDSCTYVQYDDKSHPGLPTPTDESPEDKRDVSPSQSWTEEADHWQRTSAAVSNTLQNGNQLKRHGPQRTVEQLQERVFELETYVKEASAKPMSTEKLLGVSSLILVSAQLSPSRHVSIDDKQHLSTWPATFSYQSADLPPSRSRSSAAQGCFTRLRTIVASG